MQEVMLAIDCAFASEKIKDFFITAEKSISQLFNFFKIAYKIFNL